MMCFRASIFEKVSRALSNGGKSWTTLIILHFLNGREGDEKNKSSQSVPEMSSHKMLIVAPHQK